MPIISIVVDCGSYCSPNFWRRPYRSWYGLGFIGSRAESSRDLGLGLGVGSL